MSATGPGGPAGARGGRRADLTDTARRLAAAWHLDLDAAYPGAGRSLAFAARRAGRPAVLKIPGAGANRGEPYALRAYAGDGAVLLYEYDEATGAMLLEHAPGEALSDHPDGDAAGLLVLCDLLRRLRRPAPPDVTFARVSDMAGEWAALLREGRWRIPAPERSLIEAAAGLADRYATEPDQPELLINQDASPADVLAAEREPWLLISPVPVVGEPAFEAARPLLDRLGVASRTRVARRSSGGWGPFGVDHLLGAPGTPHRVVELAALLGRGLGADPQRVRGWALIRAARDAVLESVAGRDPTADLTQAAAVYAAGPGTPATG